MHEYAMMENVIAVIRAELKKAGETPAGHTLEVTLKVGALEMHSVEAARQAFEVLTKGTDLEGARLNLIVLPVTLACTDCGFSGPLPMGAADPHEAMPVAECPQCGSLTPVQGGRGVESIELKWE
ncbi:MAG: hydrogenase maturation nickel metallochaperone HypA [Deltaproteobacteria bacterium]|nr:hydrogenase maturation nickel metallochaperone HypA [Deltaproteobacteria bacterium]